ncbi:MAG: SMI1/KNR4 family protein [Pirellulaceae bacterium]
MYSAFIIDLCDFMVDAGIATADSIRGCTDAEIEDLEQQLSLRFPAAMSVCLRRLGHACGQLMDGDAFGMGAFAEAREVAQEITTRPDSPWRLPGQVIPFLQHHGYEFLFVHANAGDDPPVWLYIETEPTERQVGV